MSSIEPGDSVLTTSGFYGTIVAINGDTVIVEFGNNKNCRIPMARQAISQIEKANGAAVAQTTTGQGEKKFLGKKKAEEAKEAAAETAQEVKEAVSEAADSVQETAAEAVSEAAETVSEAAGEKTDKQV